MCRRYRGTLSCAVRASGGEAHSHLSCVRVGSVPSLGGGLEANNILFYTVFNYTPTHGYRYLRRAEQSSVYWLLLVPNTLRRANMLQPGVHEICSLFFGIGRELVHRITGHPPLCPCSVNETGFNDQGNLDNAQWATKPRESNNNDHLKTINIRA